MTTDSCAACHRSHTADSTDLVKSAAPQSVLCLTCHDGTGANYNVASEFSDPTVPANDPTTSSFFSHPATTPSNHTSALLDEFAGVLNRHSECGDCHNSHSLSAAAPSQMAGGWTASGSLAAITGVAAGPPPVWQDTVTYEYELCVKCHSSYTALLSYTKESQKKTDTLAEFDPAGASYHPVRAAGKNNSPAMDSSLAGGSLWRFNSGSTVRCLNCHGNYRLVGNPPTLDTPASDARLAPHSSRYRGLLIANYRDRDLKPANEIYDPNDFTLCYLCHSPAPFTDVSGVPRSDTNFSLHGYHASNVAAVGAGGLDIDVAGAGQGNALCAECHFRSHGTVAAPWTDNQTYSRGVNFAPDVQPRAGQSSPIWSGPTDRSCALVCHGKDHVNEQY